MLYKVIKPILFSLDPELAHTLTLHLLNICQKLIPATVIAQPKQVMGLTFQNPIGLAAGLDKNGDFLKPLFKLGFSFIEAGTATLEPQPGNPKPRLWRLNAERNIINNMGLNNKGINHLVNNARNCKTNALLKNKIIGISIAKNNQTALANQLQDYLHCLNKAYLHADYITINVSCPNVANIKDLQENHYVADLLRNINQQRQTLANQYGKYTPLAVKISPDLSVEQLKNMLELININNMDAIIATNTTRDLKIKNYHNLCGGISGEALREKSLSVLAIIKQYANTALGVISVGGIMSALDAKQRLALGADLIQIYSGLIFNGPKIIRDITT